MPKVYLETSFISYLTSRLSRDLIVAGHQQITQEWWETRRSSFELYISKQPQYATPRAMMSPESVRPKN